jgi:hypothetical protein
LHETRQHGEEKPGAEAQVHEYRTPDDAVQKIENLLHVPAFVVVM